MHSGGTILSGATTAIAGPSERPARALSAPTAAPVCTIAAFDRPARDVRATLWREWQALAGDAAEVNCFAEPWFVAAGLRHLVAGQEVRLIEVRERRRLIGVLPATVASTYGRMRVRHVQNWQHHHDFLGTPLIRKGREADFWSAVLTHLDRADWAPAFLHIAGLVENGAVHRGLIQATRDLGRGTSVVHRLIRAALASDLTPEAYYDSRVRKKKRKEINRLRNRLAEHGSVTTRALAPGEDIAPWCDAFLALERSGWKGRAGSALGCDPHTEAFFREALAGAGAAGRLDMLRIDVDAKPIAMLVNFLAPPGGFSFKIAFNEEFARYSPGVLIELENLRVLARGDIAWMDSCAVEGHPMIDSLWSERRSVVRVTVPLSGLRRRFVHGLCRALERGSAARRALFGGIRT